MGPIPISSGSNPDTAIPLNVPNGSKFSCSAFFAFITTQADAPSESWLA